MWEAELNATVNEYVQGLVGARWYYQQQPQQGPSSMAPMMPQAAAPSSTIPNARPQSSNVRDVNLFEVSQPPYHTATSSALCDTTVDLLQLEDLDREVADILVAEKRKASQVDLRSGQAPQRARNESPSHA